MKRLLRSALKRAFAWPFFRTALLRLRGVWQESLAEQRARTVSGIALPATIATDLPEVTPIIGRRGDDATPRINLLLPGLSEAHVFGGAATALRVFDRIRRFFPRARIIVTDESVLQLQANAYYSGWPILDQLDPGFPGNHIVPIGNRYGSSLEVLPNDIFIATIWYSAYNGFLLLDWQNKVYGQPSSGIRKLIYLIQDFEPGFYPFSTRYALAASTYAHPDRTMAFFNTGILADYFHAQGYCFPDRQILEPRLHPQLALKRNSYEAFHKEMQILVYGRPGTDRNAFPMIVAALRQWAASYAGASGWRIVAAGEEFAPIELGSGCMMTSLGKLPLADYAATLAQSAIGISLMISPHPSYPPLEMAAFGLLVLTNRHANKDLAMLSSQLRNVERTDPEALAQALASACQAFETSSAETRQIRRDAIDFNGAFLDGCDELKDIEAVLQKARLLPVR